MGLRWEEHARFDQYLTVPLTEARDELERILADPRFQCSERNKKFLRFVSEALFSGREGTLKAYSIAVDVFGRPPTFDASTDPIVRIEATRLRSALSHYYELWEQGRDVCIELPKGRYVPVFSRHVRDLSETDGSAAAATYQTEAGGDTARSPWQMRVRRALGAASSLGLAGAALLFAAIFAGFGLLNSWGSKEISDRPAVSVDLELDGANDGEAGAARDSLMVALSRFETLRLSTPDIYTASTGGARSAAPAPRNRYLLRLKYQAEALRKSIWWQIVDQESGEALRSGMEVVRLENASPADPVELLVSRLAVRIASIDGAINSIETARDLQHPTLGNGCILRAGLALSTQSPQSLQQASTCLGRTLDQRPYDASAHAMLAAVLLAIDPPEAPTKLTEIARIHARQAVSLAPDSSRSFMAQMMVEFRDGQVEAAIAAGRRAIELNPYNMAIAAKLARILFSAGKRDEGARLAREVLEAEGLPSSDAEWTLAFNAYQQNAFDEALLRLQRMPAAQCYLTELLEAATLGKMGRADEMSVVVSGIRQARPDFDSRLRQDLASRHLAPELITSLEAGLAKAGLHFRP